MAKILVTGSASYDTLVELEDFPPPRSGTLFSRSCREVVGGTGAGKALTAARLFEHTVYHCVLGDDDEGHRIRQRLERESLTLMADLDPAGTERHINLMNQAGERQSIYTRYATFEPKVDLVRLASEVAQADAVVLNITNYCRRLIPGAREHRKELWVDIHDYDGRNPYHVDFVEAADWLFFSSEGMTGWRGFMQRMVGKKAVVCTHGRRGSTLYADGKFVDLPILEAYTRVDTNGAGDAFLVGFLYARLNGHGLEDCQKYATICGGLAAASPELVHDALGREFLEAEFQRHYGG